VTEFFNVKNHLSEKWQSCYS